MNDKSIEPSYEKIVLDFDKWLKEQPGRFVGEEGLEILREICKKWIELKMEYINFMMRKHNFLMNLNKDTIIGGKYIK